MGVAGEASPYRYISSRTTAPASICSMPTGSSASFNVSTGATSLRGTVLVWQLPNASFTATAAGCGPRRNSIKEPLFTSLSRAALPRRYKESVRHRVDDEVDSKAESFNRGFERVLAAIDVVPEILEVIVVTGDDPHVAVFVE